MSTRYIQLSSAYRNREQYPNVGEFVVPLATTDKSVYDGSYYAEAFPTYEFARGQANAIQPFLSSNNKTPYVANLLLTYYDNDSTKWYLGYAAARMDDLSVENFRLVTDYDRTTGKLTLRNPLRNPPFVANITPFVTQGTLIDASPGAFPPYDGLGPTVSDSFNTQALDIYYRTPFAGVNIFDNYYVVAEQLPAPGTGRPEYSTIYRYYPEVNTIATEFKMDPVLTAFCNRYSVRKRLPIQKYFTVLSSPTQWQVEITPVTGFTAADYVGKMIYFPPSYIDSPLVYPIVPSNQMTFPEYAYVIQSFDPATNLVTLDRKVNDILYNQVGPEQVFVGREYEILPEPVTTSSPLKYSGSTVSQGNDVCYNVALVDLLLPNVTLTTGARIVEYPYVYVELRTDGNDFRVGENIITSNNPNARHALFNCAVTNIVDPAAATFVKIDASSMLQSIKFKPNSSLYFKVYLPDGTPFQPAQADNPSPLPANALLQVEATFALTRV